MHENIINSYSLELRRIVKYNLITASTSIILGYYWFTFLLLAYFIVGAFSRIAILILVILFNLVLLKLLGNTSNRTIVKLIYLSSFIASIVGLNFDQTIGTVIIAIIPLLYLFQTGLIDLMKRIERTNHFNKTYTHNNFAEMAIETNLYYIKKRFNWLIYTHLIGGLISSFIFVLIVLNINFLNNQTNNYITLILLATIMILIVRYLYDGVNKENAIEESH